MPAALPDLEESQPHPLKRWRERQKPALSVDAVADLWRMSPGYLSQIETRMRVPGGKIARLISEKTGISIDLLLNVELRDKKSRARRKRQAARAA